jgi:predicted ATPase
MKHNENPRRLFSQPKEICMDEFEVDDIMKES